jgi:hypothetical protein
MQEAKRKIELPEIAEGEIYVGLIGDHKGSAYHLILLPGDAGRQTWAEAKAWAASVSGDLPNRVEQVMLWANFHSEFKRDRYWSNEAEGSGWAWYQDFSYGTQLDFHQGLRFRARAVRRLFI